MCGIFGIICCNREAYGCGNLAEAFRKLALFSESRGKESCGFAAKDFFDGKITVIRGALPVSEALKRGEVNEFIKEAFKTGGIPVSPLAVIGHSRLVTNGSQSNDYNNQPVIKDGIAAIHNGIIVNAKDLWNKYPELKREYDIDTEILPAMIRRRLREGRGLKEAIISSVWEAEGTVSSILLFSEFQHVCLYTNNGSLYYLTDNSGLMIFASEENILNKLAVSCRIIKKNPDYRIVHVDPGISLIINPFSGRIVSGADIKQKYERAKIILLPEVKNGKMNSSLVNIEKEDHNPRTIYEKSLLEYNYEAVSRLKRCSRCLLPETFPYIKFDEFGVCNYCTGYVKKNQVKPIESLKEMIAPYKRSGKSADCIIPYSGGRDSTFVLHYSKTELGMKPVAFTYDWGMVTDLARRNIARVCGKLGVENIIVSADIAWKRENIRKNILAWLNKPNLGMIPLFMAGDKYFFYYTHKVKQQTGIHLNIWGINPLENTDFKVGFAGIEPKFDKERIYSLNYKSQLKLLLFMAKNFTRNPGYLNQSLPDTFGSYLVRYFYPRQDYYHLFDYLQWDEEMIEDTIIREYNWEKAVDTKSTWRIGDGTAGFYNYIYYNTAGFSENDTFRSNQIREGMISRERALELTADENIPRYEAIKWYLQILGLDYETIIKRINKIPKLYKTRI